MWYADPVRSLQSGPSASDPTWSYELPLGLLESGRGSRSAPTKRVERARIQLFENAHQRQAVVFVFRVVERIL